MSQRLLIFGDDHSPHADVAWLWINNHRWRGWHLQVITAEPVFPPRPDPDLSPDLQPWTPPNSRHPFADAGFAACEHLHSNDDPRITLSGHTSDLTVVGTRGLGHVKGLLLGSTADDLLHHPFNPVAFIRHADPARHILVGVDTSEPSRHGVEVLAGLPWVTDTTVTLLTVNNGSDAGTAVQNAVGVLSAAGAVVTPRYADGRPAQVIVQEADSCDADLIVLGTSGLIGRERHHSPSISAEVAHHTQRNVLVVPMPFQTDDTDPSSSSTTG